MTCDRNIIKEFGVRFTYPTGTLRPWDILPFIVGGGLTNSTFGSAVTDSSFCDSALTLDALGLRLRVD